MCTRGCELFEEIKSQNDTEGNILLIKGCMPLVIPPVLIHLLVVCNCELILLFFPCIHIYTSSDLLPIISNDEFKLVPYSSPYLHASGAYQFVYDASSLPKYSNNSLVSFILEAVPFSNSEVNVLTTYYWLVS